MNRIRNAHLELHPELEKYFVSSRYDDWPGIATTMRLDKVPQREGLLERPVSEIHAASPLSKN